MAGDDISMESSNLKRRKIRSLPDSVLLHILSFLPMKDTVRTVMVSRFRCLWTSARHLSFDHHAYHNCKEEDTFRVNDRFVNFTDHVLNLHENPTINSFRLNLNYAADVYPDDPQYGGGATEETRRSDKIEFEGLTKLDLARSDIKHLTIVSLWDLELVCPNVKILDIAGCTMNVKAVVVPFLCFGFCLHLLVLCFSSRDNVLDEE
ncbi:F-box protein At3g59000-like [Rhodamnia argentea]|uniref:F-box protein At3g59000-like n=1 Tax=Rhodamnia argentea TaxID=178133 RepID=A0ABM3HAK0_9MYRT|nr:F-box protein At3g59000-like [Rhodamnia argentea]